MSGNAFKDHEVSDASYTDYLDVLSILSTIFNANVKAAGSTQFFEQEKGRSWEMARPKKDLDFVIELSKQEIIHVIDENIHFLKHRKFGNTVSTLMRVHNKLVHVDLMPSVNTENEAWIMSGGSLSFKGVIRNVLLCYLARLFSESETERLGEETKWTIAFPGGMGLKQNGICLNRNTSPRFILGKLGLANSDEQIETSRTFEGLVSLVVWDKQKLERFKDYAKEQWLYKKSPEVLELAFDYLDKHNTNL